jgi:hypothetical protein
MRNEKKRVKSFNIKKRILLCISKMNKSRFQFINITNELNNEFLKKNPKILYKKIEKQYEQYRKSVLVLQKLFRKKTSY